MEMEGLELISFEIISSVGSAKSMYIEAIREAKKGNFEKAHELIEEGGKIFVEGHKAHADLIQRSAAGEDVKIDMLLMHAEDQLLSTETIKIMADEFIEVYESLKK